MENIQINGQKILGPPRDWRGPPPPHGTEIYIKNLPDNVYEVELYQVFSMVGTVYEVRVPVHWSGVNRGYAFVRYTRMADADAAIKAFDGLEIRAGRQLKIERSVDNTRLFLSSVPNHKTGDEIKADLQGVVENVERVYVYPTLENQSVYRGYAFVEFLTHRDAAIAKRILTPDMCLTLFDKKCIAAWANPLPFLDQSVLKTINILFMRNIPKEIKNKTIQKAIENLLNDNSIQKVKRLNNYAFLTFINHESAKAALEIIKCHPDFLGDRKIQIEWAVPRDMNTNSSSEFDIDNSFENITDNHLQKKGLLSYKLHNNNSKCRKEATSCMNLTDSQKSWEHGDVVIAKRDSSLQSFPKPVEKKFEPRPIVCRSAKEAPLATRRTVPGIIRLASLDLSEVGSDLDTRSTESLRSSQRPGGLLNSCSSSPPLTGSSLESPSDWSNDEYGGGRQFFGGTRFQQLSGLGQKKSPGDMFSRFDGVL